MKLTPEKCKFLHTEILFSSEFTSDIAVHVGFLKVGYQTKKVS